MKKLWIIAAIIAVVTIELCILTVGMTKDKTAPTITVHQERMAYSIGCDDDVILAGVVAKDNRDGDVSKNAIVVSRTVIQESKIERVDISACDNSGNVTTIELLFVIEGESIFKIYDASVYTVDMVSLQYNVGGSNINGQLSGYDVITKPNDDDSSVGDTEDPSKAEPETEAASKSEEETEKPTVEKPTTEKPTVEKPTTEKPTTEKPTTEKQTTEKPTVEKPTTEKPTTEKPTKEEPTTAAKDGKPVIELKQTEITVSVGSSQMALVGCINEIYDDKDDRSTLFRRVGISGDLNLSVPGVYIVGLYCTDLDGNTSETAQLKVIVEAPIQEVPTEPPTEPATEPPTEPVTEPPTEPATEPPTEPSTEAPAEVTDAPENDTEGGNNI